MVRPGPSLVPVPGPMPATDGVPRYRTGMFGCACGKLFRITRQTPEVDYRRHVATYTHQAWRALVAETAGNLAAAGLQ